MLRIIPQSNPAAAKSYYAHADYYAAGLDAPAVWGGKGATLLGLSGEVTVRAFHALCDNRDPRDGSPLTPRTRGDRTVLYDFNFHVPKSLSVLIERTGDDRLMGLVTAAADATMRELEAEMLTRVRRGGQDADRPTGNLVWAVIPHHTARPARDDGKPDPHTHLHVTVFNATFDGAEGRWKAGQFRDLVRDAPYWQAQFHSRLTAALADRGYAVDRTRGGWEVRGVPAAVVATFSRRTREIDALADELGVTDPDVKAKLGATSRRGKGEEGVADLRAYWDGRLTPDERAALDRVTADAAGNTGRPPRVSATQAAEYALSHCFERASVVPEKRLVAEALTYGVGGVTADQVRAEFHRRGVFTRNWEGRVVATTADVLREEQRLLAFARDGRGTQAPLAPDHTVTREWLNTGQRAAVAHVLTSPDRVVLVRGAAGTGKTTLTREAVEAIERTGTPVLLLAPSADASRGVLRQEGFATADTVAKFLADVEYREHARGGVLWVDEAGLLGAPTLARLFAAADDLDARVVLMGDSRQHAGVERGSALRVLESLGGLPVAQVTDIRRQRGEYRQAVEALSTGDAAAGFDRLDAMGWIHEVGDDDARDRQVAAEYAEATRTGESVLVVAPTHAEADRVTAAVRAELKHAGRLGEERVLARLTPVHLTAAERGDPLSYRPGDVLRFVRASGPHKAGDRVATTDPATLPLAHPDRFAVYHQEELTVAVGDKLRVTANGWTTDRRHRLDNGAVYAVAGFTPQGDVRLANGWVVDQGFGHWAHGYVGTSHASQGKTVDRVIVAESAASLPAASREQFYVSVSRGKAAASVYTHDRAALKASVARSDPRLSASELLLAPPGPPRVPAADPHRLAVLRQRLKLIARAGRAAPPARGRERSGPGLEMEA